VLEAEQRLLSTDLRGPPQGIAVATTPTNKPQQTTTPAVVASDSLVEVSNDTTNASSIAVGFKDILKNSISKLIEKIQGQPSPTELPAVMAKPTPRTSGKKQEDPESRFDFAESEGETFLDQLLRKLSVGKSAVEEEKSSSDDSDEDGLSKLKSSLFSLGAEEDSSVEDEEEDALTFLLPKKKPSAASVRASKKSTAKAAVSLEQRIKQLRAENQAAKKQITSILNKVKLSSSDEITDEDRDLYEVALDDSISRGRGRKVGSSRNFIQEELNAAAKESEQLSADLEALLAELEGQ
jgi:hypothetical protein